MLKYLVIKFQETNRSTVLQQPITYPELVEEVCGAFNLKLLEVTNECEFIWTDGVEKERTVHSERSLQSAIARQTTTDLDVLIVRMAVRPSTPRP